MNDKPYDKCVTCERLGVDCDGPNFLAMTAERWCEWCRKRKNFLDKTNFWVSEQSGVSEKTVERIMAGNCADMRRSTQELITKALVNGSWGKHPCPNPGGETVVQYVDDAESAKKIEHLVSQVKDYKGRILMDEKLLNERADFMRAKDEEIADLKKKNKALAKQNKWLKWAAIIGWIIVSLLLPFELSDLTVGFTGWLLGLF